MLITQPMPPEASWPWNSSLTWNPKGNRTLNRAIHIIAVCQLPHPGPGRDYYNRKRAEGKTGKEALRSLKRQISNIVWRHLTDANRYR